MLMYFVLRFLLAGSHHRKNALIIVDVKYFGSACTLGLLLKLYIIYNNLLASDFFKPSCLLITNLCALIFHKMLTQYTNLKN